MSRLLGTRAVRAHRGITARESSPQDLFMSRTVALVSSFSGGLRSWMLGAAVLGASWLSACGGPADAQGGPPPAAPVSVAPAVTRTVTDHEEFSGRLEATEFVELRPRVGGIIGSAVHDRPASVPGRGGAGRVAAHRCRGPRRAGPKRTGPCPEPAGRQGRLASGIRPAHLRLAHRAASAVAMSACAWPS